MDAGTTGTSSIDAFNGMTWHELYRAFASTYRVRDVAWQHVDSGRSRLWIDQGADLVYMEFPLDVAAPLYDSGCAFQHEYVLVTPTFDDGSAKLRKYFRELNLTSSNLNGSTIVIDCDYQVDVNIGTSTWVYAGQFRNSPDAVLKLHLGNYTAIRFRFRCHTDTPTTAPIIDAYSLDGFTRTPNRVLWNLRIRTGDQQTYTSEPDHNSSELLRALRDAAQYPGTVKMTSVYPELHNRHVIISSPNVVRSFLNRVMKIWTGQMTLSFLDVT
jgi:hypothetical protein